MKDKIEEAIRKGAKAAALWADETFTEAREGVRAAIIRKWAEAPLRDREGQHELKLMLKLLDDLEANLQRVMNDGKKAAHDLEIKRSVKERVRRMF